MWQDEQEQVFTAMKQALVSGLVLALPDFTKPFEIEIYANDKGIVTILHQSGHPIAFVSKSLGPRHQSLSRYEKECLAILLAMDHSPQALLPDEHGVYNQDRQKKLGSFG